MLDSLLSMFKKEKSGKVAKKRLQMVLIQDRASVSPEVMEKLRDSVKIVGIIVVVGVLHVDVGCFEFDEKQRNTVDETYDVGTATI